MRSTPWPNDTLRTVKEARVPPRCMPMTTPSKIWMRSLSPSRTLTCTLTVSPDFIAGRSASCDFSTNSIALMTRSFKLSQQLRFLVVQTRGVQKVRPPLQGPAQRLSLTPPPDLRVIARQQHVGNAEIADLRRPRVLRMVQQPAAERILRDRLLVSHHTRYEPRHGVQHDKGRQFAAGQHIIADRQFLGDPLAHPLVEPFVTAAQQHKVVEPAQPDGFGLREAPPLWRRHDGAGGDQLPRADGLLDEIG